MPFVNDLFMDAMGQAFFYQQKAKDAKDAE